MAPGRPPHVVTLHRFFLSAACFQGDRAVFPPEQANQIRRVLRLRPGERVIVLDGSGSEAVLRLDEVGETVGGTVEERRPNLAEPVRRLTLYQGLLKAAKFELVLQKGTEIGVSAFVPLVTERSVPAAPSPGRLARFDVIAREAAEQSRRGRLPAVRAPLPLGEAAGQAVAAGPAVLLWEEEERCHLRDLPLPRDVTTLSLFVGPEGGFSPPEVAAARSGGVRTATLGRRVLRAETAALVGAALLLQRVGELG